MAERVTVDEFLDRGEEAIKFDLLEWGRTLTPKQLPASIRVMYKPSYAGKTETLLDLPVRERIQTVTPILDEIRACLSKAAGGAPLVDGVLTLRAASNGNKDSPELTRSRRLCAPMGSELAEITFLRSELANARAWGQFLQTQLLDFAKSGHALTGQLAGQLQALATTRAATTSMADVSPAHLLIGAILLPVLLPRINKIIGLKPDARVDQTLDRVQAFGSIQLERLLGKLEPEPAPEPPRKGLTVRELVESDSDSDGEEPGARRGPAPDPVPLPPPGADEVVDLLVSDEDWREAFFSRLVARPEALAVVREKAAALLPLFA